MLVSKNLIIFNKAFLIYTKANFRNGILECRKRVFLVCFQCVCVCVCLLSSQKKTVLFVEITKCRGVCHSYRQRATCHWESSEHWKSSAPWRLGWGGRGKIRSIFFGDLKNKHKKLVSKRKATKKMRPQNSCF